MRLTWTAAPALELLGASLRATDPLVAWLAAMLECCRARLAQPYRQKLFRRVKVAMSPSSWTSRPHARRPHHLSLKPMQCCPSRLQLRILRVPLAAVPAHKLLSFLGLLQRSSCVALTSHAGPQKAVPVPFQRSRLRDQAAGAQPSPCTGPAGRHQGPQLPVHSPRRSSGDQARQPGSATASCPAARPRARD